MTSKPPHVVLIHGGKSTAPKLEQAWPGAHVTVLYRPGLSSAYDEHSGLAKDHPTLDALLKAEVPDYAGGPLYLLGYSAGGWALRHYLRSPSARERIAGAAFLDSTYGDPANLAPFGGALQYARENPGRLVVTWSLAHPGPGNVGRAMQARVPSIVTRAATNADHGAQQSVEGPAVVREVFAKLPGAPSAGDIVVPLLFCAALVYAAGVRW